MAIKIRRDGAVEVEIFKLTYNEKQHLFIAKDDIGEDICRFSYPLERDKEFNTSYDQFNLYLFHKDSFAANDIFHIKCRGHRLGWLFPIQALLTDQHDYADDKHFFPYSFNAYKCLLWNKANLPYKVCDGDSSPTLDAIYGENTIVLILSKKFLKTFRSSFHEDFMLEDYLVSLYRFGYTLMSTSNFKNLHSFKEATSNYEEVSGKAIDLTSISKELIEDKQYLNSLIQGLIKLENHPIVKFHLLYSVIELLISKIFEYEFSATVEQFKTSSDFYKSKESLIELANEKRRIKELFGRKSPGLSQVKIKAVQSTCNKFLVFVFGQDSNLEPAPALYSVRSTIFHNFRKVPDGYQPPLTEIVTNLENLILELCIKLKLT